MAEAPFDADPFDLDRFVTAQAVNYADALRELRAGRKETHWMWYVLPQLRGLGRSDFAHFYGLTGLEEARAYLAHPILGPRLLDCARAILSHPDRSAERIMGRVDGQKLQSTATLFALAAEATGRGPRPGLDPGPPAPPAPGLAGGPGSGPGRDVRQPSAPAGTAAGIADTMRAILSRHYGGQPCPRTLALL